MKIGSDDISKIYLGNEEINKIYLGSETVYEKQSTSYIPFTSGQYGELVLDLGDVKDNPYYVYGSSGLEYGGSVRGTSSVHTFDRIYVSNSTEKVMQPTKLTWKLWTKSAGNAPYPINADGTVNTSDTPRYEWVITSFDPTATDSRILSNTFNPYSWGNNYLKNVFCEIIFDKPIASSVTENLVPQRESNGSWSYYFSSTSSSLYSTDTYTWLDIDGNVLPSFTPGSTYGVRINSVYNNTSSNELVGGYYSYTSVRLKISSRSFRTGNITTTYRYNYYKNEDQYLYLNYWGSDAPTGLDDQDLMGEATGDYNYLSDHKYLGKLHFMENTNTPEYIEDLR